MKPLASWLLVALLAAACQTGNAPPDAAAADLAGLADMASLGDMAASADLASTDLAHVADNGPHVLLLSIDGLHGSDLERYIVAKPASALAGLAAAGTRFLDVKTPLPSDSYPGQLALATGGTPRSTGVYYDLSYDRRLSPPGSKCMTRGTPVDFTEAIDVNANVLDGGGGINTAWLPLDPDHGCQPVLPHQYLRVNTTFEVVKKAGMRTAWLDKHLSYEILQGPSGQGIDDLDNPEIAAKGHKTLAGVTAYDHVKRAALLEQIAGRDHAGAAVGVVPALFGMNFQAVSVMQKTVGSGYTDAQGTPSADLQAALDDTDQSIGMIVAALRAGGLWQRTTLVVTAVHGQAPIDPALRQVLAPGVLSTIVEGVRPGLLAHLTADDIGLIWLTDQSAAGDVAKALLANAKSAGIDTVLAGAALRIQFPDPLVDSRTPDVIVLVKPGVLYATSNKGAEHGGASDDDRKVPLLVVGPGVTAGTASKTPVETRQIAPTALKRLGLDPGALQAVAAEGTAPLPGL